MRRILTLISLAFLMGCPGVHYPPQVVIYLDIMNEDGTNIYFEPDSNYDPEDTWLYYYNQDMELVKYYTSNLDAPRHFTIVEDSSIWMNPVFGDMDGTYHEDGLSTTYIDFGNGDIDTLQVAGEYSDDRQIISQVWYNGVEYPKSSIVIEKEF